MSTWNEGQEMQNIQHLQLTAPKGEKPTDGTKKRLETIMTGMPVIDLSAVFSGAISILKTAMLSDNSLVKYL